MKNTIFIKGFKQYPKNYEVVVGIGEDCPDSQKGLITVLRASTKQEAKAAVKEKHPEVYIFDVYRI